MCDTFLELVQAASAYVHTPKQNPSIPPSDRISFIPHDFIYCQMIKGYRALVSHFTWNNTPDTTPVILPHRYSTEYWDSPDIRIIHIPPYRDTKVIVKESDEIENEHSRRITKFAYDCCCIMDFKFDYYYRHFYLGSFFHMPTSFPLVEKYIERVETINRIRYISQELVDENRNVGSSLVCKAIGIELAIEAHEEYIQNAEKLNMLCTIVPNDIIRYIICPYVINGPYVNINIRDYCRYPVEEEWTHEGLIECPFVWSVYFKYSASNTIIREECNRKDYIHFSVGKTIVGLFLDHKTIPKAECNEYPSKAKLVFHSVQSPDLVFYSTRWVDCPDYSIHKETICVLNSINWPHDG